MSRQSDGDEWSFDMETPEWREHYIRSLRGQAQRFLRRNANGTEQCEEHFRCPRFGGDDPVIEAATLLAAIRVDKPLPLRRARMLLNDPSHVSSGVDVMMNMLDKMLGLDHGDGVWSLEPL